MDQHRFFNACMILMNLDMHELVEAGIIKAGNVDNGGTSWKRFNDEPLTFLAKLDDPKRDALWKLIEARQTEADRYGQGRRDVLNAILSLNPTVAEKLAKLSERDPDPQGRLPFDVVFWVTEVAAQLGIEPKEDAE